MIPQGIHSVFFETNSEPVKNKMIAVGTITERKGHHLTIQAMQQVVQQMENIQLEIIGTLSNENYYRKLKNEVAELHLDKQIHIYTDLSFDKMMEHYKEAELFILHSEEESQGIVFCEAMAMGKPIVATNVGGIPFIVKDNENGLLANFGDIPKFAADIINLIQNNDLYSAISTRNKTESSKYKWSVISSEVTKFYKEIISKKNYN